MLGFHPSQILENAHPDLVLDLARLGRVIGGVIDFELERPFEIPA